MTSASLILTVEDIGQSRRIEAGKALTIGRSEDVDWYLPDASSEPTLSRQHCRIEVEEAGASVTDCDSTNGTWLNGARLPAHQPTPLRSGDVLGVGPYSMKAEWVRAKLPVTTPAIVARDPGEAPPGPERSAQSHGVPPGRRRGRGDPLGGSLEHTPSPTRPAGPVRRPKFDPGASSGPQHEARSPLRPAQVAEKVPLPPVKNDVPDPFGLSDLNSLAGKAAATVDPAPDLLPAPSTAAAKPETVDIAPHDAVRAFLEGAGVPASVLEGRDPETFFREAGQIMAGLADGVRLLLAARSMVKGHLDLRPTQIAAEDNNALKLCVTRTEAATSLLGARKPGYLSPMSTVQASIRDLQTHELAIVDAMQSAIDELLGQFSPTNLEARLADAGTLSTLIQGGRRARLWELYQQRYDEIAELARRKFLGGVDEAFRAGYQRRSAEVTLQFDAVGQSLR